MCETQTSDRHGGHHHRTSDARGFIGCLHLFSRAPAGGRFAWALDVHVARAIRTIGSDAAPNGRAMGRETPGELQDRLALRQPPTGACCASFKDAALLRVFVHLCPPSPSFLGARPRRLALVFCPQRLFARSRTSVPIPDRIPPSARLPTLKALTCIRIRKGRLSNRRPESNAARPFPPGRD